MAAKGYNVGIMDVDLHGPDVPRMLGLKGMLDLNENRKIIPMAHSENLKAVSIESLSGFNCPHCSETIDLFGSGGGEKTAQTAGIKFLGRIPFDLDVVACGDSGTSFQQKNKNSPVTKAFANIAEIVSAS